jgi:hypothetical protein
MKCCLDDYRGVVHDEESHSRGSQIIDVALIGFGVDANLVAK